MALDPGTRFGPYEIAATLGAGGMGEVYRATDTRLRRDVALKVLKSELGADADRLRRMEQEALATAALNHPNIVSVYDVGREQGRPYVVAELLEGETLRERLRQGALPVRKAIDLSVQLANGLAAAHQKGITHRDLKPENLFMTRDGRLKILDFGLAKMVSPVPAPETATGLPGTEPGVVMGTIGYMAPEQLRGQPVDHRSDIFSTGAVLYEMLSGERAFRGDSPADTMSAILHQDPPSLSSARQVPPSLERILERCLEKHPNDRFHSAHDLGIALEALTASGTDAGGPAAVGRRRISAGWVAAALSLAGAALAIAWGIGQRVPTPESPLVRFSVSRPPDTTFVDAEVSLPVVQLALSPDGQHLAFVAKKAGGPATIWLRRLDALEAVPLPGTEGALYPFWSPDSRSLGFFAAGKIKRIDLASGRSQILADAAGPRGGTWNSQGTIVFAATGFGLFRVAASGGPVEKATTLDVSHGETTHLWPQFLPDGKHFLYLLRSDQGQRSVHVASIDGAPSRMLVENAESGLYVTPGYLLFIRDRSLMAVRWNHSSMSPEGDAVVVAQDVRASSASYGPMSASDTGILAIGGRIAATGQPTWFDRGGQKMGTVGPADDYLELRLSPDDRLIAMTKAEPAGIGSDIWIFDRRRNAMTRVTFTPTLDGSQVWSPDASRILLRTNRRGIIEFYEMPVGESGAERYVATPTFTGQATDWATSGERIVYHTPQPETGIDLYLLDPRKGTVEPFLRTPFDQVQGKFSPDDKWIAYTSNESGNWEVYARSRDVTGRKRLLSTRGGVQPFWRGDMKEIFYLALDGTLMRVPLSGTSDLDAGEPQPMFQTGLAREFDNIYRTHYTVTSDGQRFLINVPSEGGAPTSMTVIVNWTRGLVTSDGVSVRE